MPNIPRRIRMPPLRSSPSRATSARRTANRSNSENASNRLVTLLSNTEGRHGSAKSGTQVPRGSLLAEYKSESTLSTLDFDQAELPKDRSEASRWAVTQGRVQSRALRREPSSPRSFSSRSVWKRQPAASEELAEERRGRWRRHP